MIEGIFLRPEEKLPIVFEMKTARHYIFQPGQRLDIWIGSDQYISGYYAPGFDKNEDLTDHLWHAHPDMDTGISLTGPSGRTAK